MGMIILFTGTVALAAILTVPQGGTGSNTLTGILQGNGTSAFTPITVGSGLNFSSNTLSATSTGTIGGSIANKQVAFGTASNTIGGNASFTWDNTLKHFIVGDPLGSAGSTFFDLNDSTNKITLQNEGETRIQDILGNEFLSIMPNNFQGGFGDIDDTGAGDQIFFDANSGDIGSVGGIDVELNAANYFRVFDKSSNNPVMIDGYNNGNPSLLMGAIGYGNQTQITLNDAIGTINENADLWNAGDTTNSMSETLEQIDNDAGTFSFYGLGHVLGDRIALFDNTNRTWKLGDVDGDFNGTEEVGDDMGETIIEKIPSGGNFLVQDTGGDDFFDTNTGNNPTGYWGDHSGTGHDTQESFDDSTGLWNFMSTDPGSNYNYNLPLSNGTSGQVLSTSGGIAANTSWVSLPIPGVIPHTIFTPSTGGTVNLVKNSYNAINPSGAIIALTVNFPPTPSDGDFVEIKYDQGVTTITYTGGTIAGGTSSAALGAYVKFTYDSGTSKWY